LPEYEKSIGKNQKLIWRSTAKILPFVYSSVEKKQKQFLLMLETYQLGLLGVKMNGTNIMEI